MTPRRASESPAAPSARRPGIRDIVGFLAFSHGWTWLFWSASGLWGTSVWEPPATFFFVIGGAGVFLGGLAMSRVTYGRKGLGELGRRIIDPRGVPARWWAVVLLLWPAFNVLAAGVSFGLGLTEAPLDPAGAIARLLDPPGLLAMIGFILIIGPLPEEIGWRGYLLDRLQIRWTALTASLVIGLIWWSWHLPLFALPGYFDAFGRATPTPWDFLYGILPAAVIYSWIYNNTSRSVLALILFHFMQNFSGEFLGIAEETRSVRLMLQAAAAVLVVLVWGPRTLRRGRSLESPPPDRRVERAE